MRLHLNLRQRLFHKLHNLVFHNTHFWQIFKSISTPCWFFCVLIVWQFTRNRESWKTRSCNSRDPAYNDLPVKRAANVANVTGDIDMWKLQNPFNTFALAKSLMQTQSVRAQSVEMYCERWTSTLMNLHALIITIRSPKQKNDSLL